MIVRMNFCHPDNIQYIRCPAKVGRNIDKLFWEFQAWMYDRNNDHGHWFPAGEDDNGEIIYGVSYGGIDFVNWLNNIRYARRKKKVATHLWTTKVPPRKKIRF